MRPHPRLLLALLLLGTPAAAGTVTLEPDADATLIEDPGGEWANGSGPYFFVGRTEGAGARRALLRFDVAAAVPRHAIIESVSLTLHMSTNNPVALEVGLHRLLAGWGEGPSFASGGGGALSLPGDATWIHRFYDDLLWTRAGGQFVARVSARREMTVPGSYNWSSTNRLLADVRLWKSAPATNHGWILLGDETVPQTAKRIASREHPDPARRPRLVIGYRLPDGALAAD